MRTGQDTAWKSSHKLEDLLLTGNSLRPTNFEYDIFMTPQLIRNNMESHFFGIYHHKFIFVPEWHIFNMAPTPSVNLIFAWGALESVSECCALKLIFIPSSAPSFALRATAMQPITWPWTRTFSFWPFGCLPNSPLPQCLGTTVAMPYQWPQGPLWELSRLSCHVLLQSNIIPMRTWI